jgi:hypothetical protein
MLVTADPPAGPGRWPWLVIGAGVAYCLFLQTRIAPDVYYSSDGGLKFLQVRQMISGGPGALRLDLRLPAEPWVQALWDRGLFPFEPPFVYTWGGRRLVEYPPFFAAVSAPLYAWLGFRGLYVVPLVATWLLWWAFLRTCARQGLGPGLTAAALVALVFAAPLTLYSAMFWEHAPAVLLAWLGLAGAVAPAPGFSPGHAALSGAVLGLSAWLRPEHLLLVALACGWLLVLRGGPMTPRGRAAFFAGAGLAVGVFLAWNWAISGSPLGLQGLQVTSGPNFDPRRGPAVLRQLAALTARTFPLGVVAAAAAAACLVRPLSRLLSATDRFLLALALSFVAVFSFVFANDGGKQWGPRYLLVLVPVLTLLAARLLRAVGDRASGLAPLQRRAVAALFGAATLVGAWINTVGGARDLAGDYAHRILPALRLIRQAAPRVVVTDSMFVAMELTATFAEKRWFVIHAGRPEELALLAAAMHGAGEGRLLAVVGRAERLVPELRIGGATPLRLRLQGPRTAGTLNVYEGELSDVP